MVKKVSLGIVCLFFCFISFACAAGNQCFGDFENVEYIRNYDGDTITVNIKDVHPLLGHEIRIRVRGIDCPEIRAKCDGEKELAKSAKDLVNRFCRRDLKMTLKNVQRDKYFRIVADVYILELNLRDILIKYNLAVPYDGGAKINWCDRLE